MSNEAISAIRSVRLAAHELANVCAAMIGGVEMAVSTTTADTIGQSVRGLSPKKTRHVRKITVNCASHNLRYGQGFSPMDDKPQFSISPSAIQATVFAALRYLTVLLAGWTAIMGFVGKRDLSGAIVYVQSEDFLAFVSAALALGTLVYGLYKTYWHRKALVEVKNSPDTIVPDSVLALKGKDDSSGPGALAILPVLFLVSASLLMTACSTVGNDVRLNANKAFLTAQVALVSAQQTTLAFCSVPTKPVAACDKAIDLLREAAKAETAGYTAQQSGNAADLQSSILVLTNLPPQLVALGILKAN